MKLARTLAASATVTAAVLAAGATGYAAHTPAAPPVHDLKGNVTDRTSRFAGVDRYDTAVQISRNTWDSDTAAVVFLATGDNYPDALAMGASTGLLGPILFVHRDTIPDVTRQEIRRLIPCEVVVIGDRGVVSDPVLSEADTFASPSGKKCTA